MELQGLEGEAEGLEELAEEDLARQVEVDQLERVEEVLQGEEEKWPQEGAEEALE